MRGVIRLNIMKYHDEMVHHTAPQNSLIRFFPDPVGKMSINIWPLEENCLASGIRQQNNASSINENRGRTVGTLIYVEQNAEIPSKYK